MWAKGGLKYFTCGYLCHEICFISHCGEIKTFLPGSLCGSLCGQMKPVSRYHRLVLKGFLKIPSDCRQNQSQFIVCINLTKTLPGNLTESRLFNKEKVSEETLRWRDSTVSVGGRDEKTLTRWQSRKQINPVGFALCCFLISRPYFFLSERGCRETPERTALWVWKKIYCKSETARCWQRKNSQRHGGGGRWSPGCHSRLFRTECSRLATAMTRSWEQRSGMWV